jgi:hypothetical protein
MAGQLSEDDWDSLLRRIAAGKCTPFLGAGASADSLPVAAKIAEKWAGRDGYPLPDKSDLARVAQFVAIKRNDAMWPKDELAEQFSQAEPPDFRADDNVYGLLAELPVPVYITTNYDTFMAQALRSRNRDAKEELCPWTGRVREIRPSLFGPESTFKPTPQTPLVYYLHGSSELAESMVLTEDDYLDFLVWMSRAAPVLPAPINYALGGTALLFIGYSRMDWNFKVLFRSLIAAMGSNGRPSVAVQLPPDAADEQTRQNVQDYLTRYFSKIQALPVRVYWGKAQEFTCELRTRWKKFQESKDAEPNEPVRGAASL